jgi:hypothetical protein
MFNGGMTKTQAIALFGSARKLAMALGVTKARVHQLPPELPLRDQDRIVGAALRVRVIRSADALKRRLEALPA